MLVTVLSVYCIDVLTFFDKPGLVYGAVVLPSQSDGALLS